MNPSVGEPSTQVLPAPRFSSSRPALPGGRHPACGFVHLLLAAEQAPRTSWSRLVEEVLLEGQFQGPGLEEKTWPKGTDRAAKSQPLRNPKRVELAQRFPGAGGKRGVGKRENAVQGKMRGQ